ncbi:hypothetical protein DVY63_26725, partial [Salmonella enterica]|nr:hypothetical protein [Salmonella enterica]EAP9635730.1 hypothetical protein [Salmonella enterica]EAR1299435.1 hypothetical protein [Salmonella enterica]EAS4158762.1 hypothetical protein [Salmonella enterica]EAV1253679.1 hypothetical protein [Salmonella enterica]
CLPHDCTRVNQAHNQGKFLPFGKPVFLNWLTCRNRGYPTAITQPYNIVRFPDAAQVHIRDDNTEDEHHNNNTNDTT